MGLYDSFVPKGKFKLPCGHRMLPKDLQTKAMGESMRVFRQNRKIRLKSMDINMTLGNGWVEVYSSCNKCKRFYYYHVIVRDGKWIETKYSHEGKL